MVCALSTRRERERERERDFRSRPFDSSLHLLFLFVSDLLYKDSFSNFHPFIHLVLFLSQIFFRFQRNVHCSTRITLTFTLSLCIFKQKMLKHYFYSHSDTSFASIVVLDLLDAAFDHTHVESWSVGSGIGPWRQDR